MKGLYGFGDYAAGNVVMLLGFYEEVPMDSETVSHGGVEVSGRNSCSSSWTSNEAGALLLRGVGRVLSFCLNSVADVLARLDKAALFDRGVQARAKR